MKKFLSKVVLVIASVLLLGLFKPLIGLYKLHRYYPNPKLGAIKLINPNNNNLKHTLVIGCSNLQHNIKFDSVQNNLDFDVDFLYFTASPNSTFLQFLVDEGYTKGYQQIVLYLPYVMFKKSYFPKVSIGGLRYFSGYSYTRSAILHAPYYLFYNWDDYFDSVRSYRPGPESDHSFILHTDAVIDSLGQNSTSYSNCDLKFVKEKHIGTRFHYDADDVGFINSLKRGNQKITIILTPLEDIKENRSLLEESNIMKAGFKNIINQPCTLDSSLFFDQWLHLNACGRKIETQNMIDLLKRSQQNN